MMAKAVSAFKANAMQVVDRVTKTREAIVITKRGRALVRVVPYQVISAAPVPGKFAEALVFERDIVSPLGAELWEAKKHSGG